MSNAIEQAIMAVDRMHAQQVQRRTKQNDPMIIWMISIVARLASGAAQIVRDPNARPEELLKTIDEAHDFIERATSTTQ